MKTLEVKFVPSGAYILAKRGRKIVGHIGYKNGEPYYCFSSPSAPSYCTLSPKDGSVETCKNRIVELLNQTL